MSMSTHVDGIVPPDEKWKHMKIIYDACVAANVHIPPEVDRFFEGYRPDPRGIIINLDRNQHHACTEYVGDGCQGYEVDLSKLDPKIKILRFTNSW